MKKPKPLGPGDRIEIVRKGEVRHSGEVISRTWTDDGGAWSSELEILRLQVDGLGVRVFAREHSARGVIGDWKPKAKDMRRLGRVSIRRTQRTRVDVFFDQDANHEELDADAAEEDAAREMGGDDFVEYERATGKQIGAK